MLKKSVKFSNLSLEEIKVPVKIGDIQTFAIVGNERLNIEDSDEVKNNYTVSLQHPEFGISHFKIIMDEDNKVLALDSPEWINDEIMNDILLAITTPNK